MKKNPSNAKKMAETAKKRFKEDTKAGHHEAADYWAGQAAGAYLLSNPGKGSVHWHFFEGERPVYHEHEKGHKKHDHPLLQGYRKDMKQNPLLTTIGNSALAGVGAGLGFGGARAITESKDTKSRGLLTLMVLGGILTYALWAQQNGELDL